MKKTNKTHDLISIGILDTINALLTSLMSLTYRTGLEELHSKISTLQEDVLQERNKARFDNDL